ncbi:hypothetical protein RUMHYD_00938 [Blautia hydrogenotrophica DSM 10507]|uniref:Uncharacterized protein n=1 Tax=Blautia hydrogenotrophica (strain DSM 10507 / JCM 14656 / S5a33) TaxID=476272 RepID=C0CJC0_BLAHS|nr:hypothetical protein RUMHYD_00938 [Blautia hydrogenotrophica DSM 10507]
MKQRKGRLSLIFPCGNKAEQRGIILWKKSSPEIISVENMILWKRFMSKVHF